MEDANRLMAQKCRSCIACDEDGALVLDYLGRECRFGLVGRPGVFSEAFTFVIEEQERRAPVNDKIADYYLRLRRYWEKMAPGWMAEMREHYERAAESPEQRDR